MYKVMIVEDEMLVRIGIRNSVEWSKYDMEVIADLPDGQAAWELYRRERPDLIITDIRMPRMDGMTLIANIREQDKATRLVVLSCLEEFELVRKAMSLGVSNYILKLTMTSEEIDGVLRGVAEELRVQENKQHSREEPVRATANLLLMTEKIIKDYVFYSIYTEDEFARFVEQNDLKLSPVRMVVCIMEIDRLEQIRKKFKDEHGHLVKMTMMNILEEILSDGKRGEAVSLDEQKYLLLLQFEDIASENAIRQQTHRLLMHVQEVMRSFYNGSLSFGVSGIRNGYSTLPRMYAESQRALTRKFLAGGGKIHAAGEPVDMTAILVVLERIRKYEPFRQWLPSQGVTTFEKLLEAFASGLQGERKALEITLYQLVQWIHTSLYDYGRNERTLLFNITDRLEQCDTLPEMLELLEAHIAELAEEMKNRMQMSSEITKAIHYIKLHYKDNISLQTVAAHVNLSFGYLSNLFKKEFGMTFVDYLNSYRVERAKELLLMTQIKSYDIAVEVGFSPEYTYFSKVFKKITGLNPNEFRKQRLSDGSVHS
ncbi:response regulator [Cohnella sp. GCM10027633]|uniref:response regulator transcription factor n=1 Tax=unclassified Cohnella TaxID=2636738 RepID=UPI0036441B36